MFLPVIEKKERRGKGWRMGGGWKDSYGRTHVAEDKGEISALYFCIFVFLMVEILGCEGNTLGTRRVRDC